VYDTAAVSALLKLCRALIGSGAVQSKDQAVDRTGPQTFLTG
jgi:hypothetical protein